MSGVKIIDVKIIGLCSKCRKEGDEIPRYKNGELVPDKDIECINKSFGKCKSEGGRE